MGINNYMPYTKGTFSEAFIPTHNTAFATGVGGDGTALGFIATSTISENVTFTLHNDTTVVFPAVPAGTYNLAIKKIAAATSGNTAKFVVFY